MENLARMNYKHLENTYKGKKVFVTGHTGFKGSWLLSWLNILGAEIKGYALEPLNKNDLYNEINGNKLCNSIISDIRNVEKLTSDVKSFQPDFIFHLAAQPLVRLSYEIPLETFEVNAIGTANILEASKHINKPCNIVCITTDKVYENKEWDYPYREVDRLGGHDPYSASKACSELIVNSYRNSFFNQKNNSSHKLVSTRSGNVIGGGDWSQDRIIPDIMRALKNNETIKLRNPYSIRPWQHVLDPIGGYLHLGSLMYCDKVPLSNSYNFGPNISDNLTVEDITKMAIHVWGEGKYENIENTQNVHEAKLLKLDISLAKKELFWEPKYDAENAIKKTIEWYKEGISTMNQIKEFIN